ncbi:MAG: DUF2225 domain-containing protein [Clostridiales bacterium]|jgi:uncharacterized protein (DUF2225 family)|nr:DUF2225 domain-containing protein [Clostridiales bacterium]
MDLTEESVDKCVLHKSFICNVCGGEFKERIIRQTKLKFISSDTDLHPNFEPVDPLLYDVLVCPHCGYSALNMFFNKVTSKQAAVIKREITPKFAARNYSKVMTFAQALDKYMLALITAIIRGSKKGELGYICTKIAWVYRLMGKDERYKVFAAKAVTGFEAAYEQEDFPICQMDEATLGYLVAYFKFVEEKYDDSLKWVSRIITNRNSSERVKEKSRELKSVIQEKLRGK